MNKDLFYQKMQPYVEAGMVREIYSSDHLNIICFGELCYVACPYVLVNNNPIGVYVTPKTVKELVEKNRKIYPLMETVFSDVQKYNNIIYDFAPEKINTWKEWLEESRKITKNKHLDQNLEEELAQTMKGKSR